MVKRFEAKRIVNKKLYFYRRELDVNYYSNYIKMQLLTYKILLHKEPEGLYTATVPALPGCTTFGENVEHAIQMAKEAIKIYIEELQSGGEHIPDDSTTLEYSLNLTARAVRLKVLLDC